jgi:2-polyprenyl-3-methyl-5-hydroxy-6-metoxy-1,4-benzoquinol methylase
MNKSEKFFDKVSRKSKPEPNQTASKIIEFSKEFLEKDNYLLDFGCGSGAITNKLAEVVKEIDAIDISSGMLEFAEKQAENNSISNINYIQASIFDERFKDKKFDTILAFNVLHYIEAMPKLIEKINTLLKPNGLFISSTACLKDKRSLIGCLVLLLAKIGIMPKIYFYKKNELETLITNGNFHMIKTEKLSKLPEYFIVTRKRK